MGPPLQVQNYKDGVNYLKKILLILLLIISTTPGLFAAFDLEAYKTDQFTVFFPPGYEARAQLLLDELEAYKYIPEKTIGNKLYSLPIILEDAGQYSQGIANPIYYEISLFNYDDYEERWMRSGIIHEYTHMLQMLKSSGGPAVIKDIFGDIMSPGNFLPVWMLEGITTYNESQLSPYSGRLNNSEFEPFIGTLISEGKLPDLNKATYAPFEYPYDNAPYLFGGEFFGWLSRTYGEDKFSKFYENYGSSLLSYFTFILPAMAMDNTFREVYGKSTEELWRDWSLEEKEKFKDYKMEGEKVSNRGFYTDSPVVYGGKLYYINNRAVKTGVFDTWGFFNIIERDLKTGEEKEIISRPDYINRGIRFSKGKLYYSLEQVDFPFPNRYVTGYGYDSVLCEKDMTSGTDKELFEDFMTAFCPENAGSIIYAARETLEFGSKIMRFDPATKEKRELFKAPYSISEISSTADENIFVVSARPEKENSGIYLLDIGSKTLSKIVDTPWTEDASAVYGDKVFYSSNMGGSKRLYYYDLKEKTNFSLTKYGMARDTAYDAGNNEIYYVGLDLDGFDIYKKKFEPEKTTFENYPQPGGVLPAKADFSKGSYFDNLATLYPKIRYPYFDLHDGGTYAAGLELMGSDAVGDFSYDASLFYDTAWKRTGTIMSLGMNFLNPLFIGVDYQSLENYFDIGLQGPVYTNLLGPLSTVKPALIYAYKGSTGEKMLVPSVTADFIFPLTNGSLLLLSRIQHPWLGSNRDAESFKGELSVNQYTGDSVMKITAGLIKSTGTNSELIGAVRGYADKALGKKGVYGSAEIFRPLLKLRCGLWNPNIFLQDIVGSIFCDSAFTEMQSQLSAGAALHLETEVFMNVPLDIGVREQADRSGRFSTDLIFKVLLVY